MPNKQDSRLIIRKDRDITCIEFLDSNIIEEAKIQQISNEITRLIDAAAVPKFLISFENVEHLSSAALGTLVMFNIRIQQKHGQLRLSNIDPQIHKAFVITKLDKMFRIYKNAESALISFK